MTWPGKLTAIVLPLALVAAAAWAVLRPAGHHPAAAAARASASPVVRVAAVPPDHCPRLHTRFAGVSVTAPLASHLASFTTTTGIRPSVLEYYTSFPYRFNTVRADVAGQAGAVPLVQWLPYHHPLAAIAAGADDSYIRGFAAAAKAYRCPILLSFAHEMNGPWWPWGHGRQPAAAWIAAYQHIHDLFAFEGVTNVTWVWNPDRVSSAAAWWPGARYVDVIAYDGYFWAPSTTFASLYARALREAATLAPGKPVMIAETGAYPGPGMAAQVGGLMRGAAAGHMIGVVYFEHHSRHADWRLEDNASSAAAFRAGLRSLQRQPLPPLAQLSAS